MPLSGVNQFRGTAPVNVRQSAATASSAIVWSLRNPTGSGKIVAIKDLYLELWFDGTAAATLMRYEIIRALTVTAYGSAPTTVTVFPIKSSITSAGTESRVLDTGFTLTGSTGVKTLRNDLTMGRVPPSTTQALVKAVYRLDRATLQRGEIELAENEVLAIRSVNTSVIGDNIIGFCEFTEKAA